MKKMFQRMISLAAALMVVLSMTAMVCSAAYTENNDEYTPAPCYDEWEEETDLSKRDD